MTPGVLFNFGMQVFCLYSGIDITNTNGNLQLSFMERYIPSLHLLFLSARLLYGMECA